MFVVVFFTALRFQLFSILLAARKLEIRLSHVLPFMWSSASGSHP